MMGRYALCLVAVVLLAAGCSTSGTQTSVEPRVSDTSHSSYESTPKYSVYSVQKGDTLYQLQKQFGVPWERIVEENDGISSPGELRVGQILLIPRSAGGDTGQTEEIKRSTAASSGSPRSVAQTRLRRGSGSSRFWWPTDGTVTRRFGEKVRGFSDPGIGIIVSEPLEVYAVAGGEVIVRLEGPSAWAKVVAVRHPNNFVSWYGWLSGTTVTEGDRVQRGDKIGTCTGPQLAFRLYRDERPVDPLQYLP